MFNSEISSVVEKNFVYKLGPKNLINLRIDIISLRVPAHRWCRDIACRKVVDLWPRISDRREASRRTDTGSASNASKVHRPPCIACRRSTERNKVVKKEKNKESMPAKAIGFSVHCIACRRSTERNKGAGIKKERMTSPSRGNFNISNALNVLKLSKEKTSQTGFRH